MWWPEHPNETRALILSLIAGLIVAIINLTINILSSRVEEYQKINIYTTSLIILLVLFIIACTVWFYLRSKLDKIETTKKK
jgi:hypothetical protein